MDQVNIRIRNIWSIIEGVPYEVLNEIYELLSFDVPGAQWSPKFKGNIDDPVAKQNGWDGKIHLLKKSNRSFLTGLTYKKSLLQQSTITYDANEGTIISNFSAMIFPPWSM